MAQERATGRLIERRYPVGEQAEVHVNNVRGFVRVTGKDSTEVAVRIEVDPEQRLSDDDIERAVIQLEDDGNRVNIKVLSDQSVMNWFERRMGPPQVHCTLEVPVQTRCGVSCVSADATLANLHGDQSVNTVSGKVVATEIQGDLRLNTVSGDALVTRVTGSVRSNTVSGDLILRESAVSELRANSVSGAAEAAVGGPLAEGAQVQTVSGSFRLTVPPDFGCDAQLSSMSGSARCTLPAQIIESRRGRWHATVNGGGPLVRLASMSGSLTITAGNGAASVTAGSASAATASSGRAATPPTDERLRILQQIERKEISIEDGLARLDALRQRSNPDEGAR